VGQRQGRRFLAALPMNDEDQPPPPPRVSGFGGSDAGLAAEASRRVGSVLDAVEREATRLREEAREDAGRYLESAKHRADELVAERQRRIAELSDELLTKATALVTHLDDVAPVRQGFENLAQALGHAAERLSRESELTAADFEPQPFYEGASQPGPQEAALQPDSNPVQREESFDPYRGFPPRPHPAPHTPQAPAWQSGPPRGPDPPSPARGGPPGSTGWRELDDARMVAIQMAATGATRSGVRDHLTRALGISDTERILDEIFGANSGEDARVPWTAGPR